MHPTNPEGKLPGVFLGLSLRSVPGCGSENAAQYNLVKVFFFKWGGRRGWLRGGGVGVTAPQGMVCRTMGSGDREYASVPWFVFLTIHGRVVVFLFFLASALAHFHAPGSSP